MVKKDIFIKVKTFNGEKYKYVNIHKFKIDAIKDAFKSAKEGKRYRIVDIGTAGILSPMGARYVLYVSQKTYKPKVWKW